ncbi:uncharacterized protein LOC34618779 [Cyclospora cayetanensis]|uniref:50s ribosomal protein n=2 Tax=Cyclospora cayetanensis TaxID=88456 RepID=A0A1D3CV91_9EIME|nr:uncharacterized protein LOC34618779 [Cyclospora cayetanensis]OEH75113.1 50s ribosomal protein [Cyclospora cayetanensis]
MSKCFTPSFIAAVRCCRSVRYPVLRGHAALHAGPPSAAEAQEGEPQGSPRVRAVLEQLQHLTLLEVSELVRMSETAFGISSAAMFAAGAAPVGAGAAGGNAAAAATGAGMGGEGAPAAAEKSEFTVVLKSVPTANRITVIKTIRTMRSDLDLRAAKAFIDTLPQKVIEKAPKADAQKALEALKSAGAEVELQ